jgi:hypothetical protein
MQSDISSVKGAISLHKQNLPSYNKTKSLPQGISVNLLTPRKGVFAMASCHEMKKGEVYVCEDCGIELQVIKDCKDSGKDACGIGSEPCGFSCCGKELVRKGS